MSLKHHFELLALYNQKMNLSVYEAASHLVEADLAMDRGAYFGSVLGTLNHIVVGDTIWLQRFSRQPASANALREVAELSPPTRLDQIVFEDLGRLREYRAWLDQTIISWISGLTDRDLESVVSFKSMKGVPSSKRFSMLILHFFNHQTHHRGQLSTLLSQAGADIGVTDLLVMVPEEASL